jgi:hypothetical protein
MKTIFASLSLLILLSLQAPINAQDYVPLAVDGAHWIIRYDVMETPWHFDALWEYHAQGDTMIEDQSYLKVYRRELEINDDFMPPFNPATAYELVGLLREDAEDRKVYAIMLSEDMPYTYNTCSFGEESLLFDFSLSVGDTASFCVLPDIGWPIEITQITETNYYGVDTRIFQTTISEYFEGIGSVYGLFEEMFAPLKSQNDRYVVSTFLAYYCRETPCDYIVSSPEQPALADLSIYPNPAGDQVWIQLPANTNMATAQIELLSPTSNLLIRLKPEERFFKLATSHFPDGLYLLRLWNGEKWVGHKVLIN